MEIGPVSNQNNPEQGTTRTEVERPQQLPVVDRTDQVEISLEARKLLADTADQKLKENGRELAPAEESGEDFDRIRAIREKIESGYYDQATVRDSIVDRLMDDLEP